MGAERDGYQSNRKRNLMSYLWRCGGLAIRLSCHGTKDIRKREKKSEGTGLRRYCRRKRGCWGDTGCNVNDKKRKVLQTALNEPKNRSLEMRRRRGFGGDESDEEKDGTRRAENMEANKRA